MRVERRQRQRRQVHSERMSRGLRSNRGSLGSNREGVVKIYNQKAARRRETRRIINN